MSRFGSRAQDLALTALRPFAGPLLRLLRGEAPWHRGTSPTTVDPVPPNLVAGSRADLDEEYLDRLKKHLIRYDPPEAAPSGRTAHTSAQRKRIEGRDWPKVGETMIGLKRLDNIEMCVRAVVRDSIPGDLIECGVWRGGTTIFMRAALEVFGNTDKTVWAADSFAGLPKPDADHYPADAGDYHWVFDELAAPLDEVKANFARYGLLDERVRFLPGWFKDTLPTAPVAQLSVLRLDGDLYESTMQDLTYLYPKLVPGGFVIIDDFGAIPACAKAVHDYRSENGVTEEIQEIDWTGVYWRKEA